jgi:hypothetical protein
MYAEAVRELPDSGASIYEAKLDGYRCLAAKRPGGVALCAAAICSPQGFLKSPVLSRRAVTTVV